MCCVMWHLPVSLQIFSKTREFKKKNPYMVEFFEEADEAAGFFIKFV